MCVVRVEPEAELEDLRNNDPAYLADVGLIDWLLLPLPVLIDLPANA